MKHGMSMTPIYRAWRKMIERCESEYDQKYHVYGGRGISVCEEWHEFENFFADMGERPDGRTLDRVDNNGNYCPSNCRWATYIEQANNTSFVNRYLYKGGLMTAREIEGITGVKPKTFKARIRRGWGLERAATEVAFIGKNQRWEL